MLQGQFAEKVSWNLRIKLRITGLGPITLEEAVASTAVSCAILLPLISSLKATQSVQLSILSTSLDLK